MGIRTGTYRLMDGALVTVSETATGYRITTERYVLFVSEEEVMR